MPAESALSSSEAAALPAAQTVPVLAVPMRWSEALRPCALAALVTFLLMSLGLYPVVAMLSGGFLAVVFYRQRHPGVLVKAGAGGRLGALSGLFTFGVTAVVAALAATVPDVRTKMQDQLFEGLQKWAGSNPGDPKIQSVMEQLKTPQGFVMTAIAFGVSLFLLSLVLGSLGGALGGVIFSRRDRS
ncbi:MAG TPA: hypothetical protein VMD99_11650 [Terriglobales bacterium]|nr:hypothetical protein [Terriglobales bacterium]